MNYILFDDPEIRRALLPLTFTRPVAGIRIGALTIAEKWEKYLNAKISFLTESYLSKKFLLVSSSESIHINGAVCPTSELVVEIKKLQTGSALIQDEIIIAYRGATYSNYISFERELTIVRRPWDIFVQNGKQIREDVELLRKEKKFIPVDDRANVVYNKENIFIEEGAKVRGAILNAENGPIYIGKNAQVNEGAIIRGAFALCEEATVMMGGKMRGDITIGPFSKAGGEISNSVIFDYTNKSHDGFLGNSVLGDWCNLGAGTSTSNLKNNYSEIRLYSYKEESFINTGRQFCGLIMGDHSKSSINSMFNSGTVVGVSSNIFGAGFPSKFISSFKWGGAAGFATYDPGKAIETAQRVAERRGMALSEDIAILQAVYEIESAALKNS